MKDAPVEIGAKDLNGNGGIFCPSPMAGMKIWNTHPRVFLDIAHGGGAGAARSSPHRRSIAGR